MGSPIPEVSKFNLLLILLVIMAPKISFIKNKKKKTEEQLRRERSSVGADPNLFSGFSFYPISSDPSKQNQASGYYSQPPSQSQGQDNPGGSYSQAIIRSISPSPLDPAATFEFKFSGQRFEMIGITTPGGWFLVLPDNTHATALNDGRNRFLYRSNNAVNYFFGNFKNRKIVDYYFYHKGENDKMTDWEDTQIESYIDFWP
jgi:hypothetical protein